MDHAGERIALGGFEVEEGWVRVAYWCGGVAMGGIQFLTDEKGQKTSVVIDLKVHKELWEDLEDVLVSRSRRGEKGVSLAKVKAGLISS